MDRGAKMAGLLLQEGQRHRGEPCEPLKDAEVAHVQDARSAFDSRRRLGAQQAMGVGDDADASARR